MDCLGVIEYTVFIGGHWSWRNVHTAQPHRRCARCGNRHSPARKEKEKPGEPGTWSTFGTFSAGNDLYLLVFTGYYHVRAYLLTCLVAKRLYDRVQPKRMILTLNR